MDIINGNGNNINKEALNLYIDFMISINNGIINHIQRCLKLTGIDETIYNPATLLNNKLIELDNVFKSKGLSLYSVNNNGQMGESIVGTAIINDILYKTFNARVFLDYMAEISNETLLKPRNFSISNLGEQFKRLIGIINIKKSNIDEFGCRIDCQKINGLSVVIKEYNDLCSEIWNYKLDERIVGIISDYICEEGKYTVSDLPDLFVNSINVELKGLGLSHLIPKVKELLITSLIKKDEEKENNKKK